MTALLQFFRHFLGKGYEFLFSLFSFPGSAALPGVCDKGQFGCFLTIFFSWLFVPAIRWAFAIRPEWGSNNLAQGRAQRRPGRAQRRPGYGVRQREIALKGQN